MIALKLNTPHARRALPQTSRKADARPAPRARRQKSAGYLWALIAIVSVSALALAYVAETALATQASYQISTLKAQQQQLLQAQQDTIYQISLQTSAARIDAQAATLGMVPTQRWQYLPGSAGPVALSRTEPDTAPPGARSFADRLALALGGPTVAEARGR